MGSKVKEVNTLPFIGNVGPKTERVWKEIEEGTASGGKLSNWSKTPTS